MTQAREITDQAGRQVAVPDRITHIYAAQPYTHVLTYMLAPDMLIGHLSIIGDKDRRFLRPEAANLPLLGGAPGSGQQVNMETVLAAKPDIVLMKGNAKSDPGRATEKFAQIGLPVVFVDLENIDDYPAGIEFFGKLIGRVEKARELADRARKVLATSIARWPRLRRTNGCASITRNQPMGWPPSATSPSTPTPSNVPAAPSCITAC